MSFESQLIHTLVIERATDGAVDEYNQPSRTWATLSQVPGLVQPKTAREVAQLNQAGAVVSTYTIFLRPTEIQPSDRVRVAAGLMAGTYEIDGIRDAAGHGHHLQADARQVAV
jgi:hypothetical protein